MDSSSPQSPADSDSKQQSTALHSGTGAPIFEHGPKTRIRRNPVRAFASLTWEGGPREAYGQLLDVSLTGCLLKTETTIPTEAEVELSVTMLGTDDDTEYDLRATVRRTTTVDGRRAYGLEFCADTSDEKRTVKSLYSSTAR